MVGKSVRIKIKSVRDSSPDDNTFDSLRGAVRSSVDDSVNDSVWDGVYWSVNDGFGSNVWVMINKHIARRG